MRPDLINSPQNTKYGSSIKIIIQELYNKFLKLYRGFHIVIQALEDKCCPTSYMSSSLSSKTSSSHYSIELMCIMRHRIGHIFHYVINCTVGLTYWEHKFMYPLCSQGFWMEGFFLSTLSRGMFMQEIADGLLYWRTSIDSHFFKSLVMIFFVSSLWMLLAFFNWRSFSLAFQWQVANFCATVLPTNAHYFQRQIDCLSLFMIRRTL